MTANPLRLKSIHHVTFLVGNAKQAAFYYRKAFGFSQVAYAGLETGRRDLACYALQQGTARFVIATPYRPDTPEADHVHRHGDGVFDIAFHVESADEAFHAAVARGAAPASAPRELRDEHGAVRHAAIHTYGDTIHSLYSDLDYTGPFLPGYVAKPVPGEGVGLLRVDHMVGNVELGQMEHWANWYSDVLGFSRYISFDDQDISTEYSALMSIVMSDNSFAIKFPLNEPAMGKRKSQIDEYLDFYGGPGVQHVAMLSNDIEHTVTRLRENGVEFLNVPDSYYDLLPDRVGEIEEELEMIRRLRILVDRDEEGYLLQLFSRPVEDRPTVFFEIIQRKGSRGFGKGNFKALFEAIEREQALRGNL